ncbi:MAG: hypothetical protein KH230_09700 [Enterocloster asparagiformis]|nr:hypothetical protein [Enterocloster asparagiformis]
MKKINHKILVLVMAFGIIMVTPMLAYASGLESTTLFTGTKSLLQDASKAITGISAAITVLFTLMRCVQWQMADEHEKPQKKKAVLNTLAIGVLVVCLSGLITVVLGYYGGSTP